MNKLLLATDCFFSACLKLYTWFSACHIIQTQNFVGWFARLRCFYQLVANEKRYPTCPPLCVRLLCVGKKGWNGRVAYVGGNFYLIFNMLTNSLTFSIDNLVNFDILSLGNPNSIAFFIVSISFFSNAFCTAFSRSSYSSRSRIFA